jgi:hypothetical protein
MKLKEEIDLVCNCIGWSAYIYNNDDGTVNLDIWTTVDNEILSVEVKGLKLNNSKKGYQDFLFKFSNAKNRIKNPKYNGLIIELEDLLYKHGEDL